MEGSADNLNKQERDLKIKVTEMKITALVITTFVLFLMNCSQTPLSPQEDEMAGQEREKTTEPMGLTCTENNSTEDCSLLLTNIDYTLPEEPCQPYDFVVQVNTQYLAPAGLGDGSTTRIDWEFLPNGNAGFWVAGINQNVDSNSTGIIEMQGCFTFGSQETLKITRVVKDELGNESNELTINIPNPVQAKVVTTTASGFEVMSTYAE